MFLTGVFLGDNLPETTPGRISFTDPSFGIGGVGPDFLSLTPVLGQTFFIGDGYTSLGDLQQFIAPEGATRLFLGFADALEFGYPSSEASNYGDNYGALNTQVQLNGAQVSDVDWYSFTLQAGETSTITLSRDNTAAAGNVMLELYNDAGGLVATGNTDSANLDSYIKDFTSNTGGVFYARVSGDATGYSLLVTRNAEFDLGVPGNAQDISLTNIVLGGLGKNDVGSGSSQHIAVVGTGDSYADQGLQGIVDQLNDHTYTNFTATLITPTQADTLQELQQYDAVVVGGARYYGDQFSTYASALREYVEAGGGLVTTGWAIFSAQYLSGQARTDFDTVVPVNLSGSSDAYVYGSTFVPVGTNPILDGVPTFYVDSYTQYPNGSPQLDPGATLLGTVNGYVAAAAANIGAGRTVYLGPIYAGYTSGWNTAALRTGNADRLLEQAVAWVAIKADSYTFVANINDPLVIETTTPGDGPGEPGNSLDVSLALYGPDGSLIPATDYTETSPDGRNVYIEYNAAVGGFYRVEVRAENQTSGAYVLMVSGSSANLDHTPPVVISSSLSNNDIVPPGNLTYTAIFNEELASAGLGFDDVILTNTDTGVFIPLATNGLKGEYYNLGYYVNNLDQVDFNATPTYTRTDAQVYFGDGDYGNIPGMDGLGLYDYFAARWTGSIRIDVAETYTFYTSSDDGSRLYIDGNLVVNNDHQYGYNETGTTVSLTAGYHDLRLEFFENYSSAVISLSWTPPGGVKELIPANVLYNQYGTDINVLNYDPATSTLTVNYTNLAEGNYSLALASSSNGFRDTQGNLLDGNADGFGGDNYVVNFRVDTVGAIPLQALQAIAPAGSLIFDPPAGGNLFGPADSDDFTIVLDAGQKASVRVTPVVSGLQAQVQLIGPGGNVLDTASAAAGQTVLLQNVPIAAKGTYIVRVTSLAGSGTYETQLVLGAQIESEAWGGSSNSSLANGESIDGSTMALAGSADRMAVLGTVSNGNDDWYSFTLAAGQSASLATTRTDVPSGSGLALYLYDSAGNLLAVGIADAGNVDQAISNFVASSAGAYYVRIAAASSLPYSLVVTRSSDFGLETNEQVQDISNTGQVLGALGSGNDGYGSGGLIRVAVLNYGSAGQVVSQLSDDTYFNFSASSVTYDQIDTLVELYNYDVVMLGDSNIPHSYMAAIAPALRQWVEAGGGVVGSGWTIYSAGTSTGSPVADINAVIPVDTTGYYQYQYNPLIDITVTDHPVTASVTDFYPGTYSEYSSTVDAGATVLGYAGSVPAVVVGNVGAGRGVYIGPTYMGNPSSALASGSADRLLEQAVAWAAGDQSDRYSFQATAGQELTITTTTPGDDTGEPVNGLDARLELYAPVAAGTAVFSDSFDSVPSSLWGNEVGNWAVSDGVYFAQEGSNSPATYTSLPYELTDFSIEMDINNLQDGGVWLRSSGSGGTPTDGVMLVTGGYGGTGTGLYWHTYTNGSYSGVLNEVTGLFTPGVSDVHLRITVVGDTYQVFVNGSTTPATTLTTSPGQFSSGRIGLYDWIGQTFDNVTVTSLQDGGHFLVAGNDNGAADGRNAKIVYTPATSGIYEVRVIAAGTGQTAARGDYILQVNGANLDPALNAAPLVIATDPTEGRNFIAPPTTITLSFSEGLLATTVSASDLILDNGASASNVEFVDGRTLRFTVALTNTEGTFHYSLAAGAVSDLQGTGSVAYEGSFHVDHSGPQVVTQSPDSNAPFSVIDLTFNEDIDPATVSSVGIASFTGPDGSSLLGQITSSAW